MNKTCLYCGRPLDRKWNKRYTGEFENYCNAQHKRGQLREQRPKNRKKEGVAGSVYDFSHHNKKEKLGLPKTLLNFGEREIL